jgi:DNA-binding CsgD family transcriptional regulator
MIALAALRTRTMSAIPEHDLRDAIASTARVIAPAIAEALDWLEYGLLLVDAGGRVHFVSARARALLRSRHLCIQSGFLRAQTIGETVNLHRLIAGWARIDRPTGTCDLVAYSRVGELLLQFAPISAPPPAGIGVIGRLVAVFVIDPNAVADPSPEQLRAQFGLTAAEAAFACAIVRGQGVKECARTIGISEPTARTHLHRIFEKTGTKRQAELVRVILASRPVTRRP